MIRCKTKNNQIQVTPCIVEFYEFISVHKYVKAGTSFQDILQGHQASWEFWLCWKHQYCVSYRNQVNIFSTNVLHHQCCKSIDNSPQEYSQFRAGHELWRSEQHFQISFETKITNCQYEFQAVSWTLFLVKAHKIPLSKIFPLFI